MSNELEEVMDGELINFDVLDDLTPSRVNLTLARMVDAIDELSEDTVKRMIVAAFQPMSDTDLCQAYQSSDLQHSGPLAELLAVAAEERGLDL